MTRSINNNFEDSLVYSLCTCTLPWSLFYNFLVSSLNRALPLIQVNLHVKETMGLIHTYTLHWQMEGLMLNKGSKLQIKKETQ